MKISFNWLKEYINITDSVERVAEILTNTGLEVEGVEEVESVKGGLKGLVIGKVLTKEKHPDADRLNLTTVDVGGETPLSIVCGAPNVDAGQKVVVATVNTVLYSSEGESFKIKRSKIRGQVSEGMICAEDEIGLGDSHDGIMVLPEDVKIGTLASDYFNVSSDYMIEIGLTPNRADAMSHYGVARDLAAFYAYHGPETTITLPSTEEFKVDNDNLPIAVEVEDTEVCPRYAGISVSNVKVGPSPEWLVKRLGAIGIKSTNNVVDVTNFVLHEMGHPLHAFDADKISGNTVIVRTSKANEPFTTLDGVERKMHEKDLMICNVNEAMCIAGVFGGQKSGVTNQTKNIFLESAYFNPVSIRKTAKRHALNTDASFRYERGIDPNLSLGALKRAALLIKEVAGGEISSEIVDVNNLIAKDFEVSFNANQCRKIIGKNVDNETIKKILTALDIKVASESGDDFMLHVAPYRVDVKREIDVIEEVLRIYGYNNVEIPQKINASISYSRKPDSNKIQHIISELLSSEGFSEMMSNSLTTEKYASESKDGEVVNVLNPLSSELGILRQNLMYSGLEALAYNQNRQNEDLRLYEFGKTYHRTNDSFKENSQLSIYMTGNKSELNWTNPNQPSSFYSLKKIVEKVIHRLGLKGIQSTSLKGNDLGLEDALAYQFSGKTIASVGWVNQKTLDKFELKHQVFYAVFDWKSVVKQTNKTKIKFQELPKYPLVKRDFSLLLDKSVKFIEIEKIARKTEKKLLKEVDLFDVYEGKSLPENKKSYAVSFVLQDNEKTLNDKQIDGVMSRIQKQLEEQLGAQLR